MTPNTVKEITDAITELGDDVEKAQGEPPTTSVAQLWFRARKIKEAIHTTGLDMPVEEVAVHELRVRIAAIMGVPAAGVASPPSVDTYDDALRETHDHDALVAALAGLSDRQLVLIRTVPDELFHEAAMVARATARRR